MAKGRKRPDPPSAYRIMWLVVMFDLPVGNRTEMRRATAFRNTLLDMGFSRKQFSVYLRPYDTLEKAERAADQLRNHLVDNGEVSVLFLTDRQYGMTRNYFGKSKKRLNEMQERHEQGQLLLF